MEFQQTKSAKVKKFIKETVRVVRVLKKPDWAEFKNLAKVTGLGCVIIGVIGFIIFLLKQVIL